MPLRGWRQTRLDSKGRMLTRRFLNLLTWRLAETNLGSVNVERMEAKRIFDGQIMTSLLGFESFRGRETKRYKVPQTFYG